MNSTVQIMRPKNVTFMSRGATLTVCVVAMVAVWFGGCGVRGNLAVHSMEHGGMLSPKFTTIAYAPRGVESADLYLTDLSPAELDPGTPLDSITGHLIHIHVFLIPKAGKTPIDRNASNVTVRHIVFVRGAIGMYAGGGFLLTQGRPGDDTFGGSMRDATLKIVDMSPTFHDALGAGSMRGVVLAPLDEGAASRIASRLDDVIARLRHGR